jgi:hypothetical protein
MTMKVTTFVRIQISRSIQPLKYTLKNSTLILSLSEILSAALAMSLPILLKRFSLSHVSFRFKIASKDLTHSAFRNLKGPENYPQSRKRKFKNKLKSHQAANLANVRYSHALQEPILMTPNLLII